MQNGPQLPLREKLWHPDAMRPDSRMILPLLAAFAAGGVIGFACAWIDGATVLSFLGPLAIVPAIVPQALGRRRGFLPAILGAMLVALGVTAGWWLALILQRETVPPAMLLWAGLVLLAWVMLVLSMAMLLIPRPGRRRGLLRSAAVTILAWLWLTWPIWLGPTLAARGQPVPLWISAIHPLLAMNRAVAELGIWTQQPIAYQLTPLGQDVPYALPATLTPFLLANLLLAALTIAAAITVRRWRRSARTR